MKLESTGSLNSNVDISVPLVIGTIPVRGSPSWGETPQPSSSGPSASELESPPPYSEGSGGKQHFLLWICSQLCGSGDY